MNSNPSWKTLLSGRWQMPLALVAAVTAGLTYYRLMPRPTPVDFDQVLADLHLLEQAGRYVEAADAAANLLHYEPPFSDAELARLHALLARVIFARENAAGLRTPENLRAFLEHERIAEELGNPPDAVRRLRVAEIQMSLGDSDAAIKSLRRVHAESSGPDKRSALIQLIELERGVQDERSANRVRALLDELLADADAPDERIWWALRLRVADALAHGDLDAAAALIQQHSGRFAGADRKGYGEFFQAWLATERGDLAVAAPIVEWLEPWAHQPHPDTAALDEQGNLVSLVHWLRARLHLAEERPQLALDSFRQAGYLDPRHDYLGQTTLGTAAALSRLGRGDEARAAIRAALESAARRPWRRLALAEEFAQGLVPLAEMTWQQGHVAEALEDLELAAELGGAGLPWQERLAKAYARAADEYEESGHGRTKEHAPDQVADGHAATHADESHADASATGAVAGDHARHASHSDHNPGEVRNWRRRAGTAHRRAADMLTGDDDRRNDHLWAAAEQFDRAGLLKQMRAALTPFVESARREDLRRPRGLLMLGQVDEALGEFDAAIAWYGQVRENYPALEEAARARVATVHCLIGKGPEHHAAAEMLLTDLLEDGRVAPDAAVYREGLLLLGELLFSQSRYGESIGRLQNALTLYGDDPERPRVEFTLADAYRRSGLTLRDGTEPEGHAEGRKRLLQAADHFGALAVRPARAALEMELQTLAQTYQADCLFEVNEPETLAGALGLYRRIAAQQEGRPAAMTARVQMANIHLRRGEDAEAGRLLEQARWQLRAIPAAEFAAQPGPSRQHWESFFGGLEGSGWLPRVAPQ